MVSQPMMGHIVSLLFLSLSFFESSPSAVFRKYKIVHEGVECVRFRPEFRYNIWLHKFNKTTPVIDSDFEILDPKLGTYQVWIEGYERLGLEHIYTKSAISLSSTYCDFLGGKFLINRGFRDYGNFPTKCPLKPGNYTLRNYVIDEKYLPPFAPGNHWRLDFYLGPVGVKVHSNDTAKFSYYCKVVYL